MRMRDRRPGGDRRRLTSHEAKGDRSAALELCSGPAPECARCTLDMLEDGRDDARAALVRRQHDRSRLVGTRGPCLAEQVCQRRELRGGMATTGTKRSRRRHAEHSDPNFSRCGLAARISVTSRIQPGSRGIPRLFDPVGLVPRILRISMRGGSKARIGGIGSVQRATSTSAC